MKGYDVKLNNNVFMPMIGLGVYKTNDASEMNEAVEYAVEAGYRSFDTAQMYENEGLLGEALKLTGISREELFLTSKVDNGNQGYDSTLRSFQESLSKLQTDYLDLFLIHWPGQQKGRCVETWKAMVKLYREGYVRAVGVSNFLPRHLEWLLENSDVVPAVNQVERHPLQAQKDLKAWCDTRGIVLEAWAPLLRGNFDLPQIRRLSDKYKKTPAQIMLRWDIQSGVAAIPKSVHRGRIFENIDIFDFNIEEEDMSLLDSMDTGFHSSKDPEVFDF